MQSDNQNNGERLTRPGSSPSVTFVIHAAILSLCVLFLSACPHKPLSDPHKDKAKECSDCHPWPRFRPTSAKRCLHCHEPVAQRIQERRGYHASPDAASQRCGQCHREHTGPSISGWRRDEEEFRRDHEKIGGFPLRGAHADAKCDACHKTKQPSGLRTYLTETSDCQSCHAKESPHGPLRDHACEKCHGEDAWKPSLSPLRFDHQKDTRYPLEEKHKAVDCITCHPDNKYRLSVERYADCAPCHEGTHGGSFGLELCRTCHTAARDFKEAIPFDHDTTRFELARGHALSRMKHGCQDCHKPTARDVPSLECASCHKNPHRTRFARQAQCTTCHTGTTWAESVFDHGKQTRFLLTGNHATRTLKECRSCHDGKGKAEFANLSGLVTGPGPASSFPIKCMGCHTHAKVHEGRFKSQDCLECHETPGKEQLKRCRQGGERDEACVGKMTAFGHGSGSRFPLSGGHDLLRMKDRCQSCHREAAQGFAGLSMACVSCHGEKDPHKGSLGTGCEGCHDARTPTWKNTKRFNHQRTAFPLQGAHQKTACAKCHPGAKPATQYKPRPTLCGDEQCHQKDDIQHTRRRSTNCGDAGCHDPRDNGWIIPAARKGTKL